MDGIEDVVKALNEELAKYNDENPESACAACSWGADSAFTTIDPEGNPKTENFPVFHQPGLEKALGELKSACK